jgi:hypothetical protein
MRYIRGLPRTPMETHKHTNKLRRKRHFYEALSCSRTHSLCFFQVQSISCLSQMFIQCWGVEGIFFFLLLALQPTVGFSLLSDSLPSCSFFTLHSPTSYSHYLLIFFNVHDPSLPWSSSDSRTYRFPLQYSLRCSLVIHPHHVRCGRNACHKRHASLPPTSQKWTKNSFWLLFRKCPFQFFTRSLVILTGI